MVPTAYHKKKMDHSSVLGIDVGERRIGVALASLQAKLASPLTIIDAGAEPVAKIQNLVDETGSSRVVVGLPRNLNGEDTAQTSSVREFAGILSEKLSVPVVLQDEAVTSVEAENRLKARGKPYDKGDIDAEAAAIILQDYLQRMQERTA